MATSKTSKASKTVEKKSGRKTAENSPQTGEERFIATGKSVYPAQARKGSTGRFWRKEGQVNGRTRCKLSAHCVAADTDAAVTA